MYLSMHILRNLKAFEYMNAMLESHLTSQQLHLIRTLHTTFCHASQISVSIFRNYNIQTNCMHVL